jgi:hypothetical protein
MIDVQVGSIQLLWSFSPAGDRLIKEISIKLEKHKVALFHLAYYGGVNGIVLW